MSIHQVKDRLCLALDVDSLDEAIKFTKLLKDTIGVFKIGSQLFTKEGPKAVKAITDNGGKVFLDLKFHDIPNTVANSVRMAAQLGVHMLNIHASGGSEMMSAAAEALGDESQKLGIPTPILLAVTVLTSINQNIIKNELGINRQLEDHVVHLAKLAKNSGMAGVVASPIEISKIRKSCGTDFVILTPGIRPAWSLNKDDQKRITTPGEAINRGANYIVIGRPILKASNPLQAAKKVIEDMEDVNG